MPTFQHSSKIEFSAIGHNVLDLHCPRCGENNLHQIGVTVYYRGEDAEYIVKTNVQGATTSTEMVANKESDNPSSRRDGLAIQFRCEHCTGYPTDILELTIAQHKGSTEVGWRFSPLNPKS